MTKRYTVNGLVYDDRTRKMRSAKLLVQITNDAIGKTLSISNDTLQFTVPYEPIEKAMKGG